MVDSAPGKMDASDDIRELAGQRVGRVLKGKWTIDRLVGVGGMAVVYAATHRNSKKVAIKMLHPEYSNDDGIRKRFLREGYVANTVEHAGAVSVHDDDVDEDGAAFLVMELLEGESLESRWARRGYELPADEVLALMDQVLDTLVAAHEKSIVHRDLKPENMFFTANGAVKILDFGIARLREGSSATTTTTQHGALMGTPAFMPPEQARGRWDRVDGRTDLWAVGASMFTLISGQHVHVAETMNEAVAFAATQPARSIATVTRNLHHSVVALIDRALEYEQDKRWPDARTMQAALREAYQALQGRADAEAGAIAPPEPSTAGEAAVPRSGIPAATGDRQGSLTTSRGVVSQATGGGTSRTRGALVLGAVIVAGAGAVGVNWAFSAGSDEPAGAHAGPDLSAPASPAAPKPRSDDVPSEPVVTPVDSAKMGSLSADDMPPDKGKEAEPTPAPKASPPPAPKTKPRPKIVSGAEQKPAPAPQPASKPKPAPAVDPFAKRN